MINLFKYITNKYVYNIIIHNYPGQDYCYITEDNLETIMLKEGLYDENGDLTDMMSYCLFAKYISTEIYQLTNNSQEIGMLQNNGNMRMLKWNEPNKCYYGVIDGYII